MPRFGVYLPNVEWDYLPGPKGLVDYAVAAEELGFHSIWVEDRLLHSRVGILEALTTLIYVAGRTQRIQLGTSVLLVNLCNPLVLAKTLSTLDYLSDGRVICGVSLGGRPEEYQAAGVPMGTRVTQFLETLRALRALWGQGSWEGVSRGFQPTDLGMFPKSVQPRIPLWIGGRAEAVYQRVVTLGDGWLAPSTINSEEFALRWASIKQRATEAGRDLGELTPAEFCYVHVDESSERALDTLKAALPKYYDFPYDPTNLSVYGPPSRCAEAAQAMLDAGVETLIFATVTGDIAQLERLAREVIPALR